MKLLQFIQNGKTIIGVLKDNAIVPITALGSNFPNDMLSLIAAGENTVDKLKDALVKYKGDTIPQSDVSYAAPISNPGKFLCLGVNYVDHAKEGNNVIADHPTVFIRIPSSFAAHEQDLLLPKVDYKLDYEAELLVVIGKTSKYLTRDNALDAVWGYSLFNDGSMRRYQRWSSQWTLGKNFDQTGGFGPWIVTADELPLGADGLNIQMRLNGQVMQNANTHDMVFDVITTLVELTECMTLHPGDCIAMGTPAGVGYPRNPPVFMKQGDIAEVEVEKIGVLRNGIVNEV